MHQGAVQMCFSYPRSTTVFTSSHIRISDQLPNISGWWLIARIELNEFAHNLEVALVALRRGVSTLVWGVRVVPYRKYQRRIL
jgi:hypothetical protein